MTRQVKLLKAIFDFGESHHPPNWIACKDDVVYVVDETLGVLSVRHTKEGDRTFLVGPEEYEEYSND